MSRKHTNFDHYKYGKPDLMTELTICESFSSAGSPYASAMNISKGYGSLLGEFLVSHGMLKQGSVIMEAGGGYGSLMRSLLEDYHSFIGRVFMADLSLHMLNKQRDTLSEWNGIVGYVQAEIQTLISAVQGVDLIILNEVIGDLDVAADISADNLPRDVYELISRYDLEKPEGGCFNFNIGAARLVEEICRKDIPVFISEHSSDPIVPDNMDYLYDGLRNGFPREIKLHDHSEYTIRFSHLSRIAEAWGREVLTGPLIDLIGIKDTPAMRFIFSNRICGTGTQEIIYEVLDNIREYRWMIIR